MHAYDVRRCAGPDYAQNEAVGEDDSSQRGNRVMTILANPVGGVVVAGSDAA